MDKTRDMLKVIREGSDKYTKKPVADVPEKEIVLEKDNFVTRARILMEEAEKKSLNEAENNFNDDSHEKVFPITKTTPQFGDVRVSQEESVIKTVGEQVKFDDESLLFYPDANDLVFNGEIPSLNASFQFRYNDPSGVGCYIWADALQLSDENTRTIGKIKDAFENYKQGLINNADLFEKLKKVSERNQ